MRQQVAFDVIQKNSTCDEMYKRLERLRCSLCNEVLGTNRVCTACNCSHVAGAAAEQSVKSAAWPTVAPHSSIHLAEAQKSPDTHCR